MDTITLSEQVKSTLSGSHYEREPHWNQASSMGLEPIGESSAYAIAIGVHPDLPDVVVKVMSTGDEDYEEYDGCIDFIYAVYEGELSGPNYPVIHSVTDVEGKVIVIMERLEPMDVTYEYNGIRNVFFGSDAEEFMRMQNTVYGPEKHPDYGFHSGICDLDVWLRSNDRRVDLHQGNVMKRKDGTLVVIDPCC